MDEMKSILNATQSFGKFNCIFFFNGFQLHFTSIYNDVINLFHPEVVESSSFDLDKFEMSDFNVSGLFFNDNSIKKIIFIKGDEKIILEYHGGRFIIEHLFRYHNGFTGSIMPLFRKYILERIYVTIILGFELSININSFPLSLSSFKNDVSLHPIVILENNDESDLKRTDWVSDSSEISIQKITFMNKYIRDMGIS